MIKKPTLKDIAAEMNLSVSAVSRIMNGKGAEINLSPETIKRTKNYAESIGYRPFTIAKNLRLGKSGVVGVCMQTTLPRTDDMLAEILAGIFTKAAEESVAAMHFGAYSHDMYCRTIKDSLKHDLDGLIVHYNESQSSIKYIDELHNKGFNVVMLMDTKKSFKGKRVDFDHHEGGRLITSYLIGQGHRKVYHLGNSKIPSGIPRCEGYLEMMNEAGLEPFVVDLAQMNFEEAVAELQSKKPEAIFCWNDKTALILLRWLEKIDTVIPVAGFDNRSFLRYAEYRFPTIDFSSMQIGQEAVKLLIHGDKNEVITVKPRLLTIDEQKAINDF